jgi:hypothetical protein
MRDAYPRVIARVEHINKLFQNDAIADAVVWRENITRDTRVFVLRISWFLVWHVYEHKEDEIETDDFYIAVVGALLGYGAVVHFFDRKLRDHRPRP